MEYKIEVDMTPHLYDSPTAPYFWSVLNWQGIFWHNCGYGWAISPEEAWMQAYEYYNNYKEN